MCLCLFAVMEALGFGELYLIGAYKTMAVLAVVAVVAMWVMRDLWLEMWHDAIGFDPEKKKKEG